MRPKGRQGLTTGEVAKMLGISTLTVERLFDKGILTGWKHPITRWRVIDRKSIDALSKNSKGWPRRRRSRKASKLLSGSQASPPKQGLTTREASKMLGGVISQRTVIRFFDRGLLTGWRRQMTGRRIIDPKSIKSLVKKQGLTTREASRMLGVSMHRVARLFEQGILTGWKNPATGWRVINLSSVKTLAGKAGIELPSKEQIEKDLKAKALKWKWNAIPVTQKEG